MEPQKRPSSRLVTVILLVIALVGVALIVSDWKNMAPVLARSDWRFIPLVLLFTVFSYLAYSYAYALVSRLMGIQMGRRELAEVCFITVIVNHFVSLGGTVGWSLRYLMMKMYGVSFKDTLASSLLHYFLISSMMLAFTPVAFIYLLLHATVPLGVAILLGIMTVLFVLVLLLVIGLLVFPGRRRPFIHFLARLGWRILRRDFEPWLDQLDEALTRATQTIHGEPMQLVWLLLLALADFISSIVAFGFCLDALGPAASAGALLSGYVLGIMAGVISMVPGGFGIQEGSMAGIYVLLGVRFEQALLASIIFRFIFYLLPYLLILLVYNRLLRQAKQQELIEP